MSEVIDITGQRLCRLEVLKQAENAYGRTRWLCQCDCGNTHEKSGMDQHVPAGTEASLHGTSTSGMFWMEDLSTVSPLPS